MHLQTYEFVEVSGDDYRLPLNLRQSNPTLSRLPGLVMMSILAAAVVGPQIAFAACALASSSVRTALIEHPTVTVELALALLFWVVLVCLPLRSRITAILTQRHVEIAGGIVEVVDSTPFSTTTWRSPLGAFEGIAHHVRSSLSGVCHEVVLVHPNRARNVLLMTAEKIGEAEVRELGRLLDLPQVPAARIYGFGRTSGGSGATSALNEAAA